RTADGNAAAVNGGRWTADGNAAAVNGGRRTADGNAAAVNGGRWTADGAAARQARRRAYSPQRSATLQSPLPLRERVRVRGSFSLPTAHCPQPSATLQS